MATSHAVERVSQPAQRSSPNFSNSCKTLPKLVGRVSQTWASIISHQKPAPSRNGTPKPTTLISNKSVALRSIAVLKALLPKQVVAQLTALSVEGTRAFRTLPSSRVKVVFTTLEAAEAARATPT